MLNWIEYIDGVVPDVKAGERVLLCIADSKYPVVGYWEDTSYRGNKVFVEWFVDTENIYAFDKDSNEAWVESAFFTSEVLAYARYGKLPTKEGHSAYPQGEGE